MKNLLLILLCAAVSLAAVMPIGIPDPGFGIDDVRPARPNPWTSPIAGYYYVNQQTGNDAGNAYGTPAAPRGTVPYPATAGSYIEIHGEYSASPDYDKIYFVGEGGPGPWIANTSGPIWFVGESVENRPTITQRGCIITGTNVYVDGIYFNQRFETLSNNNINVSLGYVCRFSSNVVNRIVFRNCEVAGDSNQYVGIMVTGWECTAKNIVIYNNSIHDIGDLFPGAGEDTDAGGVTIDEDLDSVWLLNNTIHAISETGSRVGAGAGPNPYVGVLHSNHIYVGKNTVYDCNHTGLFLKWGADVIFSENNIYQINGGAAYPDAVCMGAQYAPRRFWMLYNRLHGAVGGIEIVSTDLSNLPVYAIGNVIYDLSGGVDNGNVYAQAGINIRGADNRYILNNTIYNVQIGINNASCPGNFYIANNIISNITSANGSHMLITSPGDGIAQNNLFYQPSNVNGGAIKISWGGSNYSTVALFNASAGGENNLSGYPMFVDTAAHNLRLSAGSPAVDAGILDSVYRVFYDLYGLNINVDADRVVRPINSVWDIGAYEYGTQTISKNVTITIRRP
jgi:hypothetical protein